MFYLGVKLQMSKWFVWRTWMWVHSLYQAFIISSMKIWNIFRPHLRFRRKRYYCSFCETLRLRDYIISWWFIILNCREGCWWHNSHNISRLKQHIISESFQVFPTKTFLYSMFTKISILPGKLQMFKERFSNGCSGIETVLSYFLTASNTRIISGRTLQAP